ncbi:unnamed protein product [Strongylus vulgaris]|uniref:Uncharacterized protein n=1 Tax=Strongylus vulgaris TaxID=40348 RepID=A0A3P7M3K3_STRVU|nr:unnamed protein product [Strongylus vulgaris]
MNRNEPEPRFERPPDPRREDGYRNRQIHKDMENAHSIVNRPTKRSGEMA